MKKRYIVIIAQPTDAMYEFSEDCRQEIESAGYKPALICVDESFFPTRIDEFNNCIADVDSIYDAHGISEFERNLPIDSHSYVDPYALMRTSIQDHIRKCDPGFDMYSVDSIIFDSDRTPWSDVELRRIFTAGNIPPDVYDLPMKANRV